MRISYPKDTHLLNKNPKSFGKCPPVFFVLSIYYLTVETGFIFSIINPVRVAGL
jgi:hypothetical protein